MRGATSSKRCVLAHRSYSRKNAVGVVGRLTSPSVAPIRISDREEKLSASLEESMLRSVFLQPHFFSAQRLVAFRPGTDDGSPAISHALQSDTKRFAHVGQAMPTPKE